MQGTMQIDQYHRIGLGDFRLDGGKACGRPGLRERTDILVVSIIATAVAGTAGTCRRIRSSSSSIGTIIVGRSSSRW